MFNKLIKDESGLSTIEILVGMIVLVLLAIIAFAAMRTGINNAASGIGVKAGTMAGSSSGRVNSSGDITSTVSW